MSILARISPYARKKLRTAINEVKDRVAEKETGLDQKENRLVKQGQAMNQRRRIRYKKRFAMRPKYGDQRVFRERKSYRTG